MATIRVGKLTRNKNGRFQSTAVKSTTKNLLDSGKRKSSDSLADTIKVSFQSECGSAELLNEVGDLHIFFSLFYSLTPTLCAVKLLKKITSEKKVTGKKVFVAITRGHKIVSSESGTRGIFLISAFSYRVPVS